MVTVMIVNEYDSGSFGNFHLCSEGNFGGTVLGRYGGIIPQGSSGTLMYREGPCPFALLDRMACSIPSEEERAGRCIFVGSSNVKGLPFECGEQTTEELCGGTRELRKKCKW